MNKQLTILGVVIILIAGAVVFALTRPKTTAPDLVGNDRDAHGCIGSAGYSWCPAKQKCLRSWEESCEAVPAPANSALTEAAAKKIAEKTCIKGSESLASGYYNDGTKTWWFDANLSSTKEGCNPACVVSEETKTAEINWRCTGLITP
ncbi:MAG: hypothetical protein V1821_00360 [bacterium]